MSPSPINLLFEAWKTFTNQSGSPPQEISPWIADSWERCRPLMDPKQPLRLRPLKENYLLTAQVSHFDLLSIARPIMEDIYQFIENTRSNVVLVNSAGYVLDAVGDTGVLKAGMRPEQLCGISFSESEVGTNAFGLSLLERVPMRVHGAEHFWQAFHHLSDAAAPIFDISGKLLGALGVLTPAENFHPHSLGIAVAGARAIEAQRQSDQLLAEQNNHLNQLNTILHTISEGILVWNAKGVVLHANPATAKLLGIPASHLMGNPLSAHVSFPQFVQQALVERKPLNDMEVELVAAGKPLHCILSLHFVHPEEEKTVVAILREAATVRRLIQRQTSAQTDFTLADFTGTSASIRQVQHLAKKAAAAHAPILLRGEAGTGKNLLARAIHNQSPRRDGPFLVYACRSVPAKLSLAELSGYAQGFFSNHPEGRPGKFELADEGTLYFQNIDALPIEAQTVLLNYLELGIVQRMGSSRPLTVDVRIIASCANPLEKQVAEGSFLADLYYRLSAFEISLPPLRKRTEDIPLLVQQILQRLGRQYRHSSLRLAPETLVLLQRYSWPGNVRELETILTRAAAQVTPQEEIAPHHLPVHVRHNQSKISSQSDLQVVPISQIEREAMLRAAQVCRGNLTQMAKMLGIGRTTAWRYAKRYNIPLDKFRKR